MFEQNPKGNLMSRMLEKKRRQQLLISENKDPQSSKESTIKLPSLRRLIKEQSRQNFESNYFFKDEPQMEASDENGEEMNKENVCSTKQNYFNKDPQSSVKYASDDSVDVKFSESNEFLCKSCPYVTRNLDSYEKHLKLHGRKTEKSLPCALKKISSKPKYEFKTQNLSQSNFSNIAPFLDSELSMNIKKENPSFNENYPIQDVTNVKIKLEVQDEREINEKDIINLVAKETFNDTLVSQNLNYLEVHADEVKFITREQTNYTLKQLKCRFCSYTTTKRYHLRRHLSSHFRLKTFKCSECEYGTYRKDHLKEHEFTHARNKEFRCFKCRFGTDSRDILISHIERHFKRKKHTCNECEFSSFSTQKFKDHLSNCSAKHYKCGLCEYVSVNKSHLKMHMKMHLSIKSES